MRRVRAAILGLTGLLLGGCFGSGSDEPTLNETNPSSGVPTRPIPAPAPTAFRALFQPSVGVLPYPTDAFFSGSTDLTLNIPVTSFNSTAAALNNLDGYSTMGSIRARFSGPINAATLTAANVRVVRIALSNTTKGPLPSNDPAFLPPQVLTIGAPGSTADISVSTAQETVGNSGLLTVEITPNRPLQASTGRLTDPDPARRRSIGYLVLLTSGITTIPPSNAAAVADTEYALIRDQAITEILAGAQTPTCAPITNQTLNRLCQLTFAHLRLGAAVGIPPQNVVLSFSFTTQSTTDVLQTVADSITAAAPPPIVAVAPPGTGPTGRLTTRDILGVASPGLANVHLGTVRIPYYLTAPSVAVPTAPLTRFWTAAGAPDTGLDPSSRNLTRFNPVPLKTADLDIPMVVTVPNSNAGPAGVMPPTGWPVVIFQHGLTRNRFDLLGIADAMASRGIAVVAIDIPLHGITPTNTTLAPFRQAGRERTFDTDLVNNATLAPGPDGQPDGSGNLFVNLGSLLTTRDNLRQAAVDLLALTRALPNLDLTGDAVGDINTNRIHFIGHSLGSIVGAVYSNFAPGVRTVSLAMPGGGVANTINDSLTFGPLIRNGLAAQSGGLLVQGTTLFNQFLRDAQNASDPGDPVTYFNSLLAGKPVHVIQIVGVPPATWPSDLVVPNSATQRLIRAGGPLIRGITTTSVVDVNNGAYVNFNAGHHGSIIDPSCSTPPVPAQPAVCAAVNAEIRSQIISLIESNALGATAVVITDGTVIAPP